MDKSANFNKEELEKLDEVIEEALDFDDLEKREDFIRNACYNNSEKITYVLNEVDFHLNKLGESGYDLIGEEISNYIVLEEVSSGGFATVYKAKHKFLGNIVAIKVFYQFSDLSDSSTTQAWKNDLKSLSRFDHNNIVKFYDGGIFEKDNNKFFYIIEEFILGKYIDVYCSKRNLSIRQTIKLFITLCEAVEAMHTSTIGPIAHLDLKPSNILVKSGRFPSVKVVDFGSSKLLKQDKKYPTRSDFFNPVSPLYAAPEQLDKDEEPNVQSDIYSLGVVLYKLLTKNYPFEYKNHDIEKYIKKVKSYHVDIIPPSKRIMENDNIRGHSVRKHSKIFRGDLDAILEKALKTSREERYQKVTEFRHDLVNFLKEKPVSAREKTIKYKIGRAVSRLFRIKRERFGWNKWKTPLLRLALGLIGLGLVITIYYLTNKAFFIDKTHSIISKNISFEKQPLDVRGRIRDDKSQKFKMVDLKLEDYFYITCNIDEKPQNCFTFVKIPATDDLGFKMGRYENEKFSSNYETKSPSFVEKEEAYASPIKKVKIEKSFYMGRFEITNKQWNIIAMGEPVNTELKKSDNNSSEPKTNITFEEAIEFCLRLSRDLKKSTGQEIKVRLPSESEWEYACRAGDESKYGMGDEFNDSFANAIDIDPKSAEWAQNFMKKLVVPPQSDSSFISNKYGLAAMNGNVWEMVSDSWHKNYEGLPLDGKSWEPIDIKQNNQGKFYVLRGGAFSRFSYMSQCSYRTKGGVKNGNDQTGFRVVIEAKEIDEIR